MTVPGKAMIHGLPVFKIIADLYQYIFILRYDGKVII